MKTNVTIKFKTKEEVLSAVEKLISLGYTNDEEWNNEAIYNDDENYLNDSLIHIFSDGEFSIFGSNPNPGNYLTETFESFTDFENSL